MAPSQNQSFTREQAAIWIDSKIKSHGIFTPSVMSVLQRLFAHREKFTFIVCRSRRFGKPAYLRRPKQVLLARSEALYVGFDIFVCLYRETVSEVFIVAYGNIVVSFPPFRLCSLCGQPA